MIYRVGPRRLADELYPKLAEYCAHEENVTVIVDRPKFDRRVRRSASRGAGQPQRRVVRERRRARVSEGLPPLARVPAP
jgi:hypothetical protein